MFKIFVNDGTEKMPKDDIFYIVCKEGIYLKKKLGIMESIAPVDGIATLQSMEMMARMHIPMLPAKKFATTVKFFREVYKEHRSESMVLIHYDEKTQLFIMAPPPQKVSYASIDYDRDVSIDGYIKVGTIHSHANFSAFHSGVDIKDEEHFDGIHVTVGNCSDEEVSVTASIVANQQRFKIDPVDYIEGIKQTRDKSPVTYTSPVKLYVWEDGKLVEKKKDEKKKPTIEYRVDNRYLTTVPEKDLHFNPDWLKLVDKSYGYTTYSRGVGFGQNQKPLIPSGVASGGYPIGMDEDPAGLYDWWYGQTVNKPEDKLNADSKGNSKKVEAADNVNLVACDTCMYRDEAVRWVLEIITEPVESYLEDEENYEIFTCSDCRHRNAAYPWALALITSDIDPDDLQNEIDVYGGADNFEQDDEIEHQKTPEELIIEQSQDPSFLNSENLNKDKTTEELNEELQSSFKDAFQQIDKVTDKNPKTEIEVPRLIEERSSQGHLIRTRLIGGLRKFLNRH